MARGRLYSIAATVACLLPSSAAAQPPIPTTVAAPNVPPAAAAAEESLARVLRTEILENLKGSYHGSEDWGRTTKAWSGIEVEGKGLKLKFSKREKEVRHGLWKKYEVELVDPHQNLHVRVANLRSDGPGRMAGQVLLDAKLHGTTRLERWRQGVKFLNFKAEADSTVEIRLDFTLAVKFVPGRFLRDVIVEPKITSVGLKMTEFDLKRVSKIDGWLAHELGDSLKDTVADQLRRREVKVAEKINLAIEKKKDRLRFSAEQLWR